MIEQPALSEMPTPSVAGRRRRLLCVLRRPRGRALRGAMSMLTLAAIGSAAVFTTQATFTDQVTMAQVTVTGGTLDLQANLGDGPGQAWAGTLSAAVTNMAPGDVASGTVEIRNNGTLPFTVTVSSTGTDASGCFGYWFRETNATGATRNTSWPVNITAMGTGSGLDGDTAALTAAVTNEPLVDVTTGPDTVWETDDVKTYTLSVRMLQSCSTNAATGSLDFTFDATQA